MRSLGSVIGLVMLSALLAVAVGPAAAGAPQPAVLAQPALAASTPALTKPSDTTHARMRGFPNARTAGVPRGWQPLRTVTGDRTVSTPGAVVKDLRIVDGDLIIDAPNVTVLRVEVQGGVIDNWRGDTCNTGLKVRKTTIRRAPGQSTEGDYPALGAGGYTARRVEILGLPEGFRVGGKDECGGVKIVNSLARVVSPDQCGDWHGDALQGYDAGHLLLRNSTLKLIERDGCGGTAPFFYPADQGNTSVTIDGLVVSGGGYSFRLGMPGTVDNLHIEAGEYYYGPIDVRCSVVSSWDADIASIEGGQPNPVRDQRCNSDGGYYATISRVRPVRAAH